MKMYLPRRPPITVHRMVLFRTTRNIQGATRVATVFRQGSGSDISRLLLMKNALAPLKRCFAMLKKTEEDNDTRATGAHTRHYNLAGLVHEKILTHPDRYTFRLEQTCFF